MLLYQIRITNFRNYFESKVDIDGADSVFLIGNNGQGKTNFLEALYYLSYGTSFKTKKEEQVISHEKDFYKIEGLFYNDEISHNIKVSYKNNKKKILFDNSLVKERKDILTNFPCLIFKYSDVFFVSGSPEYQRQYLDQMLVLSHYDYVSALQTYKKLISQKNAALKKETYDLIAIYNEQIASTGILIMKHREKAVQYIRDNLPRMFTEVFGEELNVDIAYKPSWDFLEEKEISPHNIEKIQAKLFEQHERERLLKYSLSGPQRDNMKIFLGTHEFKNVGSTGQIRILSLLLRSIQTNYYHHQKQKKMVYLFDDVLLELDTEKQKKFLLCLPKAEQSFFTFLPEEKLPFLVDSKKKKFFSIEQGIIKEFFL